MTPGGRPQSFPVWFLRDNGEFVVYARPHSRKVHSIRANP